MNRKPIHYRRPGAAHPACAGTGHVRRFRGTDQLALVTCKRCQKALAYLASPAAAPAGRPYGAWLDEVKGCLMDLGADAYDEQAAQRLHGLGYEPAAAAAELV